MQVPFKRGDDVLAFLHRSVEKTAEHKKRAEDEAN